MVKIYERENADVFAKCSEMCKNCMFCRQNRVFSSKNPTNDKSCEYSNDKEKTPSCLVVRLLEEFGKENRKLVDTQFSRVSFYHEFVEYMNDVCDSDVARYVLDKFERAWAKTLLYVFNAVHNVYTILHQMVDEHAMLRTKSFGLNDLMENTYIQADSMLKMIHRQGPLLKLCQKLDRVYEYLDAEEVQVAKLRFFGQKTALQTAKKLKICVRTVQRRTDKLLTSFVEGCYYAGLDFDWVLEEVGVNEAWLLEWFNFS